MYFEDTSVYLDLNKKKRILQELEHNAFRTIKSVYLFKNFGDYIKQLQSDEQEDKKEVYWNASYYEKLIDHVKISIAFETYNKAVLLRQGILVHKIKKQTDTKPFFNVQRQGKPVSALNFVSSLGTSTNKRNEIYLNGLTPHFETIKYSDTLNDEYQAIIGLNTDLLNNLKEINQNRNRLHFFTEFKGAFEVNSHISKWAFIKKQSFDTFESLLNTTV